MGLFNFFTSKKENFKKVNDEAYETNEMVIEVFKESKITTPMILSKVEILKKVENKAPQLLDLTKKCYKNLEMSHFISFALSLK
jgi:hypothetical protein